MREPQDDEWNLAFLEEMMRLNAERRPNGKPTFALRQLKRILERDGFHCVYCGHALGWSVGRREPTRDHLVPASMKGYGGDENMVPACRFCNQQKANKLQAPNWKLTKITPKDYSIQLRAAMRRC